MNHPVHIYIQRDAQECLPRGKIKIENTAGDPILRAKSRVARPAMRRPRRIFLVLLARTYKGDTTRFKLVPFDLLHYAPKTCATCAVLQRCITTARSPPSHPLSLVPPSLFALPSSPAPHLQPRATGVIHGEHYEGLTHRCVYSILHYCETCYETEQTGSREKGILVCHIPPRYIYGLCGTYITPSGNRAR